MAIVSSCSSHSPGPSGSAIEAAARRARLGERFRSAPRPGSPATAGAGRSAEERARGLDRGALGSAGQTGLRGIPANIGSIDLGRRAVARLASRRASPGRPSCGLQLGGDHQASARRPAGVARYAAAASPAPAQVAGPPARLRPGPGSPRRRARCGPASASSSARASPSDPSRRWSRARTRSAAPLVGRLRLSAPRRASCRQPQAPFEPAQRSGPGRRPPCRRPSSRNSSPASRWIVGGVDRLRPPRAPPRA